MKRYLDMAGLKWVIENVIRPIIKEEVAQLRKELTSQSDSK